MSALVKESGPAAEHKRVAAIASAPVRLAGSAVLSCQSDDRLVALARDGHERAFDALVERYRRPLVRFCARIVPDSRAEDAVQQAFINAHAALARDGERVDFKPWLYTIARNAALNMRRQNGWNYDQIPLDFDGVRRPDQVVEQRFELQATVAALGQLPERQRSAIVMREFEGRSYTEIAAVLGAGDGAVRQLLNRARGALRTAATALTPPPLVARAADFHFDGSRMGRTAEIIGGLGTGGVVKAGATALVAGSLVVGAVNAPLPISSHHGASHSKAAAASASPAHAPSNGFAGASSLLPVAARGHGDGTAASQGHNQRGMAHSRGRGHGGSAHGRSHGEDHAVRHGATTGGGDEGGGRRHETTRDRSGSGERSAGPEHSGSGTSGERGDTTSGSGGSGSGDDVTALSGDGSSGSSTSGSSGSDDALTSDTSSGSGTSGSSGSSDSSSTSGSGTSGSESTSTTGSDGATSGSGTSTSGSGTDG